MEVLALHGQMGMAEDWDELGRLMAGGGVDLSAVDLWGYLEDGGECESLVDFGRCLNGCGEGDILLGYSMGGRLALHAVLDDPGRWKGVVIVSAHLGLAAEERERRRVMDDIWISKLGSMGWSDFLGEWNGQEVLGGDFMPDRFLLERRREEVSRSFEFWSVSEQEDLYEDLRELEVPVLWVVGADDGKFVAQGRRAMEVLDNGELVIVEGSGHRVPWESGAEFARVLMRWVGEIGDDAV